MVDRTSTKYRNISKNAAQRHRNKRRQYLFELKKTMSCVYCGNNNPLNLDLDHIDRSTKKGTPAVMVTGGHKWDEVLAEIDKCQPVCRNCHNIKSILESNKMQGCDIEEYIPDSLKHLLHSPKDKCEP